MSTHSANIPAGFVTVQQAAADTGRSPKTIYDWVACKLIAFHRMPKRRRSCEHPRRRRYSHTLVYLADVRRLAEVARVRGK